MKTPWIILAVVVIVGALLLLGRGSLINSVAPPVENPGNGNNSSPVVPVDHGDAPTDSTWVSPGKVDIVVGSGATYPVRVEYPITIYNSRYTDATFSVKFRMPDWRAEGYEAPPEGAEDWVIIADKTPLLEPREKKDILVVLDIPDKSSSPPKWEFWITVSDTTDGGMVVAEMAIRWLVVTG